MGRIGRKKWKLLKQSRSMTMHQMWCLRNRRSWRRAVPQIGGHEQDDLLEDNMYDYSANPDGPLSSGALSPEVELPLEAPSQPPPAE